MPVGHLGLAPAAAEDFERPRARPARHIAEVFAQVKNGRSDCISDGRAMVFTLLHRELALGRKRIGHGSAHADEEMLQLEVI